MNDLESLIKGRRSVRRFSSGEIGRLKLEKLVELALWAPSSCNRQTVHFRFVRSPELIRAVAPAAFDQPILAQPITLAVVCVDTSRYRNTTLKNNLAPCLDAGLAMENFLLAAADMELGACVVAGRLNQGLIRDKLNLPRQWIVAAFIAVGVSDERQPPPERESAALHMSFDDGPVAPEESSYEAYAGRRRRWARADFDVSRYYSNPKEGLPVYRHAFLETSQRLRVGKRWLVTSTLMGAFCFDDDNVEHLAPSDDESWYLTEFLKKDIRLARGSPASEGATVPEHVYDRIVSPFDVHFLDARDMAAFQENCGRWLKPGGVLTVIFFNRNSWWGINRSLAKLLRRDLDRFRFFGYEEPASIRAVIKRFERRFRVADRMTFSFIPPLNIGYLSGRMRLLPSGFTRFFDVFGKLPLIRNFGNVAMVDFELKRDASVKETV